MHGKRLLVVPLRAGGAAALAFRLVSPVADVEPAPARTATARTAARTTG